MVCLGDVGRGVSVRVSADEVFIVVVVGRGVIDEGGSNVVYVNFSGSDIML